jgi:RNA polymerase sigma-70 factor (ECF subfamily)
MKKIHRDSELNVWVKKVEVTDELIECFEDFRKTKNNQKKSDERHIDFRGIENVENEAIIIHSEKSIEEIIFEDEKKEQIHLALSSLTEIQRRRVMLYYFDDLKLDAIAKLENVYISAVERSIKKAEKSIAKYILKNFQ